MQPFITIPPLQYIIHIFYVWIQAILSKIREYNKIETIHANTSSSSFDAVSKPIAPTITSLSEQYVTRQIGRFRKTYENDSSMLRMNENIDAIFYTKSEWSELLKDEHNFLEKKWRTKILYESTPRGNIVMYYDAYKLGFAYFSDQTMPYSMLNAVSMKYVSTFCCRDFFMDEMVLLDLSPSGIMVKHKEAIEQEKQNNKKPETNPAHRNEFAVSNAKSPFAKFKSYNNVSTKVKTTANSSKAPEEDKQLNRFINLGKICNTSFMQKYAIPTRVRIPKIEGELTTNNVYSIFETNSNKEEPEQTVHTKVTPAKLSYADYKKQMLTRKESL